MKDNILSLKNIYRLLVTDDYPVFSFSVLSEKNRKGLTLLKFWQGQLIHEFRSRPCGRMVWRSEGKRNRYSSSLLNRSPEMSFYRDYACEIAVLADLQTILSQIQTFMDFLAQHNYQHKTLMMRIETLLPLFRRDDPFYSEEIDMHLHRLLLPGDTLRRSGPVGERFHAACLLTFLTLYAAAGESMGDPVMHPLRRQEFGSIDALYKAYTQRMQAAEAASSFLTFCTEVAGKEPLPGHRHFGRKTELFDLCEAAAAGRKSLLCGLGGIGKTELVRQVIRRCLQEQLVDKIAIVQYTFDLAQSFVRAFPGCRTSDLQAEFRRILGSLNHQAAEGTRILLVIDDMNATPQEDPFLCDLASLSCSVLVTSRCMSLAGFESHPLSAPSPESCMLILRDNIGRMLHADERTLLGDLLREEMFLHPLTLRLMGRAAKANGWSLHELRRHLQQSNASFSFVEQDLNVRIDRVYRQLYSLHGLSERCQRIAELFALLPHENYSCAFLTEYFPQLFDEAGGKSSNPRELLNHLAESGWLERNEDRYSMHPLITHCLRRNHSVKGYIEPLFQRLCEQINAEYPTTIHQIHSPEHSLYRCTEIIVYVSMHNTETISRNWMFCILTAYSLLYYSREATAPHIENIKRLMKLCESRDDELTFWYWTILGRWSACEPDTILNLYQQQKRHTTISRTQFLNFCLFCGYALIGKCETSVCETIVSEALADDAPPIQKASAYYVLFLLHNACGNHERAFQIADAGSAYVQAHPDCGESLAFKLPGASLSCALRFARQEQSRQLLDHLYSILPPDATPEFRMMLSCSSATYELQFGSLEKVLEHYHEAEAFLLQSYYEEYTLQTLHGQIAITLQRLGRYDEACAIYEDILEYARHAGDEGLLQPISNNLAVVYLEMNDARSALIHLETALELGRKHGSIALAEALRNCARAYGMLGDYAREKSFLAEGAPLLEETYGAEHPRAQAARSRLAELSQP